MVLWIALAIGLVWMAIAVPFFSQLRRLWQEPVMLSPVMIIESDDWGAGTSAQGAALRQLAGVLKRAQDSRGRPAMMTLGLILAVADKAAMRAAADGRYQRSDLSDARNADTLGAIKDGVNGGVFAPMMHGLEHYWPDAVMAAAANNEGVQQWLNDESTDTESLPDALQSRWIDASVLPSRPLAGAAITQALKEEANLFAKLFGRKARIAVPTTFIWNCAVEQALAQNGVEFLITPGRRWEGRGARGEVSGGGLTMLNGEQGVGGMTYLVRDVYFEPARGHTPDHLLAAVRERARLGRPALVETHRFNFMGPTAEASLATLAAGLARVREALPNVLFMSSEELGAALSSRDSRLIEKRTLAKFAVWVRRALVIPRFRKLARLTGLAGVLTVASAACRSAPRANA